MKIEKGIISGQELMFLIISLLQGSSLLAAFISGITKQNTWIVLVIGFTITLLLLLVYTSLSQKFIGKNLIEINAVVYGHYLGNVISILYIYYFWFLTFVNSRFVADFFCTFAFSEEDINVFIIVIIITCIYTVRKGIEVLCRASSILAMFSMIVFIFITVFIANYIRLSNFLPLFQLNLKELIQGVNLMVSIPFGEIVVLLMIFPYVNDTKQVKKYAFEGLIIGGIYFLIVILRNTAVLGNLDSIHMQPSYQLASLINVGEIITRVEVLIAVVFLFNLFVKIFIFYYATVLSLAQLFKLRSYKFLVIPVGIISIIFSVIVYESPAENAYSGANMQVVFVLLFVIIFPVISLIIASIRKLT